MTDQHGNSWYVNDTRGYIDAGPSCDECGACECEVCSTCRCAICTPPEVALYVGEQGYIECNHGDPERAERADDGYHCNDRECIGLSVAYVCLDGGESLCEVCFEKSGIVLTEGE